jgi:hypothetical protein
MSLDEGIRNTVVTEDGMPEALGLFLNAVLARIGGEVLLSREELQMAATYKGVRIAFSRRDLSVHLTLRTWEGASDRPED